MQLIPSEKIPISFRVLVQAAGREVHCTRISGEEPAEQFTLFSYKGLKRTIYRFVTNVKRRAEQIAAQEEMFVQRAAALLKEGNRQSMSLRGCRGRQS